MNFLILASIMLATNFQVQGKDAKVTCTKEDAIRAETEASSLKTWDEVYRSYKNFAQCDDGGIGEGYSESIAHLLSENWSSVAQLNSLVFRDNGFETFVLRHIDELMSPSEVRKIRENVNSGCPAHAKSLCRSIRTKIKQVPSEAGRR
jgi:hypothetical protein